MSLEGAALGSVLGLDLCGGRAPSLSVRVNTLLFARARSGPGLQRNGLA